MNNIDPNKFIDAMQPTPEPSPVVFGYITSDYPGTGHPKVIIDGDLSASPKTYPYINGLPLGASNRVLLLRSANGYIVIGGIVWQ